MSKTELLNIRLSVLSISKLNMRHGCKAPDVSDILPSIREKGIRQTLLVRREGERYGVIAGRRRLFALQQIAKETGADPLVPCAVMAEADAASAIEASIIENVARLAFATNDERTAKRISEALGTKTELRSQKNYTGHRLAPWLSHMMVSRQETQRALMTPGEIMQLPATDEIVMVSGVPPVRAKKLRYFKDGNFTPRVLPPASAERVEEGQSDHWITVAAGRALSWPSDNGGGGESSGGLILEPELDPPKRYPNVDVAEVAPELDDEGPVEEDPHIKAVRRAAGLDKDGSDFLPDF